MLGRKRNMPASLVKAVLLTMLLTGCAGGTSKLPPLVQYDKEFQLKAAAELEDIELTHPHVVTLTIDYGKLRDQVRAGEKIK